MPRGGYGFWAALTSVASRSASLRVLPITISKTFRIDIQ